MYVLIVSGPDSFTTPSSGSVNSQLDMLMDQSGVETKSAHRPSCSVSTILACLNPDNQPCSFMSDGHLLFFFLQSFKNG